MPGRRQERARQAALLHTESYLARDWQSAQASSKQQQATVEGNQRNVTAERAQVQVLRARLAGQRASLASQRAALAASEVQLGYTRVTAPFDAVTTARLMRLGGGLFQGGSAHPRASGPGGAGEG